MTKANPRKPRVFIDADVLFAGAAAPGEYGASLVILRMAEITLIEAVTSQQVITETERNLTAKLPCALSTFRLIVSRCLLVVPDPYCDDLLPFTGLADPKDLSILVSAMRENCPWLITFNVRDFQPGHPSISVLRPGEFVLLVRDRLVNLSPES
jgi:predicted nucleic acid-binding protein